MRGIRHRSLTLFAIALILLSTVAQRGHAATTETAEKTEKKSAQIGKKIDNFALRDYRGVNRALKDAKRSKLVVVIFLGTECPLAKLYAPRLGKLNAEFAPKGVAFVAIDSNQQDSASDIAKYAKAYDFRFPILKDVGNAVADKFGAERTPEAFILDENRAIQYRGRIDDQYEIGLQRSKPKQNDLASAIQELLASKPVSNPVTEATGCHIGRVRKPKSDGDITYSKQIAPILQKHCVECHRDGSIAPFSLTSYDDVIGWADTIGEVVSAGRMPPWNANPEYGHFSNEARLSDEEKEQLAQWIRDGVPRGSSADLPAPKKYVEGWQISKPDKVVYMQEKPFDVAAEGKVDYKYFEVDPDFKEDKWVTAAECVPGNRSVVHHIIVHVLPPKGSGKKDRIDSDWLCATAAGSPPMQLPDGVAKRIPAGSKLRFQMHYTPNGMPQKDRSAIGLVFTSPSKVRKEAGTWKAQNDQFSIPAGDEDYVVESSNKISADTLLLSMSPHMHLRGKAFRYEARYPDGKQEILLDVPRYDFSWQNSYVLAEPKLLPAGTEVHCIAHFDNSAKNPSNPDPGKKVGWGEQTWEEMMIGYFNVVIADQDLKGGKSSAKTQSRKTGFSEIAQSGKLVLNDELRNIAQQALEGDKQFEQFVRAVHPLVPQVDRFCITSVGNEKVKVARIVETNALSGQTSAVGVEIPAANTAIAGYAKGADVVVNSDLSQAKQPDLRFMAKTMASSMHVPMTIDGIPSTVNFWSRESNAFPDEAVKFLTSLTELMAQKR